MARRIHPPLALAPRQTPLTTQPRETLARNPHTPILRAIGDQCQHQHPSPRHRRAQHRSSGVIALIQIAFDIGAIWIQTKDGDPSVRSLFDRHYSRRRYKDGRQPALFMGPGEKVVLRTPLCDAICGWRKFISSDNQEGINCAFFRSEAQKRILSSTLLLESQKYVWERWPREHRLYTYINPRKIASPNPGYCFKVAGWRQCGATKNNKLLILEYIRASHLATPALTVTR